MNISELLNAEDVQTKKLEELIKKSLDEEQLLSIRLMDLEKEDSVTFGGAIADKVAQFGGSWTFIIFFFLVLIGWIVLNVIQIGFAHFDPYPFIFLNLVLSCLASIQAPIIMMSQNRQSNKDRKRSLNDFLINMKSEMEVRNLHSKIDLLLTEQMQSLFKVQEAQLSLLEEIKESIKK
jgi:uncharacterized membrane protein